MGEQEGPRRANPPTLPQPPGYSQLVSVGGGRTVYISGQVAMDGGNNLVGAGDLQAQTEQVFRNLELAMDAAGGSLSDIVKLTIFMRDVGGLPVFRDVRDRFIAPGPDVPASSLVEVSALAHPHFLIEIEAIGWLPA